MSVYVWSNFVTLQVIEIQDVHFVTIVITNLLPITTLESKWYLVSLLIFFRLYDKRYPDIQYKKVHNLYRDKYVGL